MFVMFELPKRTAGEWFLHDKGRFARFFFPPVKFRAKLPGRGDVNSQMVYVEKRVHDVAIRVPGEK